ncbi:uncharacterized protein LOC113385839 [Ctenocephalides felis]|uniref:uncharacterized protein LOC113385839 n=1 Tax=Ctenocephalides felis TaxID=7515 RepID=UPI000E6E2816|nr:uncharacterized protein LOC113385839 [Ctenocephalides felis]
MQASPTRTVALDALGLLSQETPSSRQIKGNPQKEIISKKCLISVLECIEYLKDNTEQFGLFYQLGSRTRARDILSRIERGDQDILQSLRTHGGPLEVASALKTFLVGLRAPLMPARVQELIVADNAGVSTRTVALDALGLLSQETPSSRQRTLLLSLLGLLQKISNNANSNNTLGELEGSHAALVMLPVFFNFTVDVLPHWRRIAAVFNELLICVPGLDDPENSDSIIRTLAERPSGDLSIDIQPIPDPLVRVQDQYRQLRQNQQNNNAIISMGEGAFLPPPLYPRVFSRGRLHPVIRGGTNASMVHHHERPHTHTRTVSATR